MQFENRRGYVSFIMRNRWKEVPKVSVDVKNKKVKEVLTEVLAGTSLTFEYDKDVVTVVKRRQINLNHK